jgi:hypothetical protein
MRVMLGEDGEDIATARDVAKVIYIEIHLMGADPFRQVLTTLEAQILVGRVALLHLKSLGRHAPPLFAVFDGYTRNVSWKRYLHITSF